jgi:hypothetical protein
MGADGASWPDTKDKGEAVTMSSVVRNSRAKWWIRAGLLIAAALTVWHVWATFLWVAPPTPLRQLVPGNLLTDYMIPLYGQSWSVFAPDPINGNYTFKVRAIVDNSGKQTQTDWVDATAVELSMSEDNLFPPRAANVAVQQASQFKGAWDALTADHKVIAALGYFDGNWQKREAAKMKTYGTPAVVDAYITQERYTDAYATQVAEAVWGKNVTRVQFQIYRQNIPDFYSRKNAALPAQPLQIADVGWRGTTTLPGQNEKHFAQIFDEQRVKAGLGNE